MKNLLLWYLPQATIFIWGAWFATTIQPPMSSIAHGLFGVFLAAAYTGGVNLIISLVARLRRHDSKPSSNSLGLVRAGGGGSKPTEHR